MLYVPRVFNSVNEIERAQWEHVCSACGSPSFMDLRFVAAVEAALKPRCRFWYVILYEDGVRPVACAGLTAMKIDLTDFGDPRVRQILKHGPRFLSRFGNMSVLFCSLPGSPGDRSIAILPSAESAEILAVLDRLMVRFATDAGLDAIIFKEFAPTELECMDSLSDLGYRRIEVPPMHLLDPSFGNFSQYCGALRKKYRQSIGRSTRKLATTGIVSRVLTDPTEILEKYTPEIHEMYCEVVRRSDLKIETLPIEYYQQLVLHMHGQIELVALIKDSQILAFGWCLCDGTVYHMMYGGFDYQLNSEYDLYFNMVYACFDRAFQKRVKWIHVGQTATDFKARMGCYSEARYVYAKGLGLLMSALFRWGSNLLVIKMPARSPARIFKGREQRAPRSGGVDRRRRESDAA